MRASPRTLSASCVFHHRHEVTVRCVTRVSPYSAPETLSLPELEQTLDLAYRLRHLPVGRPYGSHGQDGYRSGKITQGANVGGQCPPGSSIQRSCSDHFSGSFDLELPSSPGDRTARIASTGTQPDRGRRGHIFQGRHPRCSTKAVVRREDSPSAQYRLRDL